MMTVCCCSTTAHGATTACTRFRPDSWRLAKTWSTHAGCEAKEEVGIEIGELKYLGSQPWPFPSSLMMAFKGVAVTTDVHVDGEETLQARWVTRDEYMSELVSGRMEAPGKATIARYMIEEWLGHDLP